MYRPEDPYPAVVSQIVAARIAGDEAAVEMLFDSIPFEAAPKRVERWPAMSVMAGIFVRDCWHCVYCGERVMLVQALRLVSKLYPDRFPYHPNWKADATHPAFAARGVTLDHIKPIAGGGDPVDPVNLATACWGCNRRKGDLTLNDLGWAIRPPADPAWKGLSDVYEPLWISAGRPALGEDEMSWMRAVTKANRSVV